MGRDTYKSVKTALCSNYRCLKSSMLGRGTYKSPKGYGGL